MYIPITLSNNYMAKCEYIRSNKKQCNAQAVQGEKYCFFHSKNPKVIEKRLKASVKGGKAGTASPNIEHFELKTVNQIMKLLEFTTNGLLQGEISREKASCIGYLSNILIGAIKDHKFEERLEAIEHAINLSKQA